MMSARVCSQCGGTKIEYDASRGDAVCTDCGIVLEESIIVSEVTFQEQSSGSSSLVGQFVSSEGGRKAPLAVAGFHHGLSRDSREVTIQQAKRRLSQLGSLLKLNQHCIDTALGFFKMALQLNLTRGRKSSIMDTACLYLVCRSEGTPHMLLDFSDVLQINVYSLGRAYLRLSTALHINPPAIDPCLYIHRFAHKLELGEKLHEVSMTALRLVARMKRDWIHHGRRPAGLCGAALLVSARVHNFHRSVKEVARVVKLSEGTVRKRLGDFKDTPSSQLTIDEFLKIDLEQEHDPPCFLEAKKRSKQQQVTHNHNQSVAAAALVSPTHLTENSLIRVQDCQSEIQEGEGHGFGGIKMISVQQIIAKARVAEAFLSVPTARLGNDLCDLASFVEEDLSAGQEEAVDEVEQDKNADDNYGELDLEGIDDEEIEQMLLSEEEVKIKSKLWFAENADYLKELEEKKERLAALRAEKSCKPRKRSQKRKQREPLFPANSAGEAIERMLVEKKISSKINYDVLRDLDKAWEQTNTETSNTMDVRVYACTEPVTQLPNSTISGEACTSSPKATVCSPQTLPPLTIARESLPNRLPSLLNRKRPLSHPFLLTNEPDTRVSKKEALSSDSKFVPAAVGVSQPVPCATDLGGTDDAMEFEVVEESGPVEYVDEGEDYDDAGIGDEEMDELAYDGDPLLHSDNEDEEFDDLEL